MSGGTTVSIVDLPRVDTVDWPPQDQQCWSLIHPRLTLLIIDLPQVDTVDWPPPPGSTVLTIDLPQVDHCWSLICPRSTLLIAPHPQDQQCWSLIRPGSTTVDRPPPTNFNFVIFNILINTNVCTLTLRSLPDCYLLRKILMRSLHQITSGSGPKSAIQLSSSITPTTLSKVQIWEFQNEDLTMTLVNIGSHELGGGSDFGSVIIWLWHLVCVGTTITPLPQ